MNPKQIIMKVYTTYPVEIKRNKIFSLVSILFFSILNLTSCFKNLDEPFNYTLSPLYEIDKRFFFTFQAGTDSFTTYGVQEINDPNTTGWDSAQSIKVITEKDSTGSDNTVLMFTIKYYIIVPYKNSGGSRTDFELGNCGGIMFMFKKGTNHIGKYTLMANTADTIWMSDNTLGGNLHRNGSSNALFYRILEKDFSCEITGEGALPSGTKYLDGTFSGMADLSSDSTALIPVSGSFRLYKR